MSVECSVLCIPALLDVLYRDTFRLVEMRFGDRYFQFVSCTPLSVDHVKLMETSWSIFGVMSIVFVHMEPEDDMYRLKQQLIDATGIPWYYGNTVFEARRDDAPEHLRYPYEAKERIVVIPNRDECKQVTQQVSDACEPLFTYYRTTFQVETNVASENRGIPDASRERRTVLPSASMDP